MSRFEKVMWWGILGTLVLVLIGSGLVVKLNEASSRVEEPKKQTFNDFAFETKGDPIVLQKLSAAVAEPGVYRYIDRETGVVVFLVKSYSDGSVSITSQKVAVK